MATSEPNKLINESSPYLLQHAYNPVQWYPWSEEALNLAKTQDKPILVSIGYSACHWCHVMEREVFENDEIAAYMNAYFINIKVDREERPDVDQIYMEALQSMNIQGGWPLNVFLTPDAKPFYGGTYFPPAHWTHLLNQISKAFHEHRDDIEKSADDFTRVLNYTEFQKYDLTESTAEFSKEDLEIIFNTLQTKFDNRLGGKKGAPKFPMPSIYLFLLRYYHQTQHQEALQHLKLSLDKMAMGGIYDQIGGGFARYSVDEEWMVPHFEKMLYDNGQLISLYAEAYKLTNSKLYKHVVYQTIDFIERELMSIEGGVYSALDADSEGVEGKFYVWTYQELKNIIKGDLALFVEYYAVKEEGNWEHNYNILHRNLSDIAFCNKHNIKEAVLNDKLKTWTELLMQERENRIRPGLDDKILTSWNGLLLQGLIDAYKAFGDEKFLTLALKNADFIRTKLLTSNNQLFHSYKNGKASINGFLEDYAFVIQGFISLYQATFDETWIYQANSLTQHTIEHFWDAEEGLFFFTSSSGEQLIARKKELFDNVIPASNSTMAYNLFLLGKYFDAAPYSSMASTMLGRTKKLLLTEPSYLSNWASLLTNYTTPYTEVVITGEEYLNWRKQIDHYYFPNLVFAGTKTKSDLTLLQGRESIDKTRIFVCQNNTCKLPVNSVEEALKQIKNQKI